MGNNCFSSNGTTNRLKENSKRLDEQLQISQREDKPQENEFIALIVHKETLPYCEKIINFLFEYHLSLRTLHFYILSQIKRLVLLTNEIHHHCIETKFNDYDYNHDRYKQSYRIRCQHSCNMIMNQLTEDSPITREIAKRIVTLFNDRGISNTVDLVRSIFRVSKCGDDNDHDNDNDSADFDGYQTKIKQKMKELLAVTKIDVEFCDYFANNILDYCEMRCHRHKSSNDDWDWNYKYHRHHLAVNWMLKSNEKGNDYNTSNCGTGKTNINMHNYKYDCQLLKKHIIKENNGQPLCSWINYKHIYFLLGNETQIVLFNIDNPKCDINLSLIWYKQVIIKSFGTIIFCLPLSWFEKIQRYDKSNEYVVDSVRKVRTSPGIKLPLSDESCRKLMNIIHFYRKIIDYDNNRHVICQKWIKSMPSNSFYDPNDNYRGGMMKKQQTAQYSKNFIIPKKTFWIIPDFDNFEWKNHNYNYKNSNINVNVNIDINKRIYTKKELGLIDHLLRWRNKPLKKLNKQLKRFYDLEGKNISEKVNYYGFDIDADLSNVEKSEHEKHERIIRYHQFCEARSDLNGQLMRHISNIGDLFGDCDDENVYYKNALNYGSSSIRSHLNDWYFYKHKVYSNFYKKYQELNKYLEAFGRNRYGSSNIIRNYNMIDTNWGRYIYMTDSNENVSGGDRDKKMAHIRCNKYDLCPLHYRNNAKKDSIGWYWIGSYDSQSDNFMEDLIRDMNCKNEYYRIFLNYPSFYSSYYGGNARDGIDAHLKLSGKIMTRVFGSRSRFDLDYISRNKRFCEEESFRYNNKIEQLFDYCENIIYYNLRYYADDKGNKAGLCVERVLNFGYYDRFINILKSKKFFDKIKIYDKHKKIQLMGCVASIDLDIFDEFDYDNYVRIAFQDWNMSIIGLIGNSKNRRVAMEKNVYGKGSCRGTRWKLWAD